MIEEQSMSPEIISAELTLDNNGKEVLVFQFKEKDLDENVVINLEEDKTCQNDLKDAFACLLKHLVNSYYELELIVSQEYSNNLNKEMFQEYINDLNKEIKTVYGELHSDSEA